MEHIYTSTLSWIEVSWLWVWVSLGSGVTDTPVYGPTLQRIHRLKINAFSYSTLSILFYA